MPGGAQVPPRREQSDPAPVRRQVPDVALRLGVAAVVDHHDVRRQRRLLDQRRDELSQAEEPLIGDDDSGEVGHRARHGRRPSGQRSR